MGLANGKVLLASFSSLKNRITKEFVPKHSRSCNAIAWNPVFTNQLAVGLDKVRGDFSSLIWDVNQVGMYRDFFIFIEYDVDRGYIFIGIN